MKVVKSAEALKRLALARGSSASVGGVKFNSTADKVVAQKAIDIPKPEHVEAPKPAVNDNTELLAKIVELLARPVITAPDIRLPDIKMPEIVMPEIKLPEQPKTIWVFKVERDVRGLMTQIVASPK